MAVPKACGSQSMVLYSDLKRLYKEEIRNIALTDGTPFRYELNIYSPSGPTAFILALAVWEAFLNEEIFKLRFHQEYVGHIYYRSEELKEAIEKSDIKSKSILLPQLFFGRTFNKGGMPFQDFRILIAIRNAMIHYKMFDFPLSAVKYLNEKGIALKKPTQSDLVWPMELYSTECIRWAINTISKMTHAFKDLTPYESPIIDIVYSEITKSDALEIFRKYKVDPGFISPEYS